MGALSGFGHASSIANRTLLCVSGYLSLRFTASEPATNKALQEVRVLGGFGHLMASHVFKRG
jgi:hypothetical protein